MAPVRKCGDIFFFVELGWSGHFLENCKWVSVYLFLLFYVIMLCIERRFKLAGRWVFCGTLTVEVF